MSEKKKRARACKKPCTEVIKAPVKKKRKAPPRVGAFTLLNGIRKDIATFSSYRQELTQNYIDVREYYLQHIHQTEGALSVMNAYADHFENLLKKKKA